MKHTRAALFAGLTLTAASVGAFVPAHAADTTVTFELTQGALNITAPASATLTPGAVSDAAVTGSLGGVSVSDQRGALDLGYTVTVKTSDYAATVDGSPVTIDASQARYRSNVVTFDGTLALGAAVPSLGLTQPDANDQWSMEFLTVGSSTASWTPDLSVVLGAGTVGGTYTGTITHSVL